MHVPYLVRVEVAPNPEIKWDSPKPIVGYSKLLGITARSESELGSLVREFVKNDEGGKVLEIGDIRTPDFDGEDADIADVCGDATKIGVWYSSGHAYFSDDS